MIYSILEVDWTRRNTFVLKDLDRAWSHSRNSQRYRSILLFDINFYFKHVAVSTVYCLNSVILEVVFFDQVIFGACYACGSFTVVSNLTGISDQIGFRLRATEQYCRDSIKPFAFQFRRKITVRIKPQKRISLNTTYRESAGSVRTL